MKKFAKIMSLLLAVAMVMSMAACGGTQDPTTGTTGAPNTQPTNVQTDNKVTYVVKVQTAGGMPLKGVDVEIYDGDKLVQFEATNAEGVYTVKMAAGTNYTVQLGNVPAGYEVRDSYSFDGNSCVISLASSVIKGEQIGTKKFQLGDIMYDFEFVDTDGVTRSLSETLAEKKMVMLNFWYSDCSWCYKEFPAINNVYGDFSDKIAIFALDDYPTDTIEDVKSWKTSLELAFPMGMSVGGMGIGSFGGTGWPMTVIIDRYGMVAMAHSGAITSEYVWKQIFTHFTAENYNQKLIVDYADIVTQQEVTEVFPGSEAIGNAINKDSDIKVTYRPDENEYVWPFVEATFNGQTCVKASNNRVDSSYSILYAEVELKAGQAVGFDYIISSELGMDYAIVIVNGDDVYQMSGYDENPQWKACYPCVALEDGVYEIAIVYMKDGTSNVGDDTIYIDNLRVIAQEDIEVDSYIPRQAAVKQDDGSYNYVEVFYNEVDGYYHVGSVNGPLLLANLMGYTQFCEDDFIYNMAIAGDIKKDGHDYYEDLTPFASYATNSKLSGYCTVTRELAEILKVVAEIKGYERNDNEWLKICEYYQSYGPTGTNLEDPIKGLAPFSAPEAVLGTWAQVDGEWVFTAKDGSEGDYNYFYYDRAIMPRGMFYAFTPEVSGAYRVTSHASSVNGVDGWLFTADGFYARTPLYTYAAEERLFMIEGNVSMVYYMEAGQTYYIDIAYWDVYEVGYIPFDLEFLGETYDMFRLASPGPFTYEEGTDFIISGGILVALGDDGYYHHVMDKNNDGIGDVDENGQLILGSILYADFSQPTPIFGDPIMDTPVVDQDGNPVLDKDGNQLYYKGLISKGAFDFSKNEYDQEILTYLRNHNNDVDATREYLQQLWGADYKTYAEAYKLEEILRGEYHGTGIDRTAEIQAYLSQVITEEGSTNGCVKVTAELAELLQELMDKFTFEGVENSWCKMCYYFDYLGQ